MSPRFGHLRSDGDAVDSELGRGRLPCHTIFQVVVDREISDLEPVRNIGDENLFDLLIGGRG